MTKELLTSCPICGSSSKCSKEEAPNYYLLFRCVEGYTFGLAEDILDMPTDLQEKLYNLIVEQLIWNPKYGDYYWYFFYEPTYKINDTLQPQYINLSDSIQSYPTNIIEQANRTLLNFSILYPKYGESIGVHYIDVHASYSKTFGRYNDADDFFKIMVEMGLLNNYEKFTGIYTISANGWKKIDELKKHQQEIKQGFIAMSFREETKYIREAFREAIKNAGYAAQIIDEKEHNNQIVPEIFYEIQRSKFVVVDVTYPNFGAYYEAGYAQGLGKEVIVCCKKDVFENKDGKFDRPHFDISQKAMVIWNDEQDLIKLLKRRIEATVRA